MIVPDAMSLAGGNREPAPSCIADLVRAQAERSPDAVAIEAPGRAPLAYGRLYAHVRETVRRLNALGIGRGDRVALVLPNGPEMAVAFLSIAAGATCAPLNPGYREAEFDFYLSDLNAKALVVGTGMESPAIAVARSRGIPVLTWQPVGAREHGSVGAWEHGSVGVWQHESEERPHLPMPPHSHTP
ncbi:MAG: AMP-binding protein, partial [Armatimonadetes bacterium]|nr:AMP-binding protein [Armatimonadota bacterium]